MISRVPSPGRKERKKVFVKVCLIKPITSRTRDYEQRHLDIGLAFLARSLMNRGHQVTYLDCMREGMGQESFAAWLEGVNVDAYCFKVYSHGVREASAQVQAIKRVHPGALVLIGGPHPSGVGPGVLNQFPEADFAFRGEAEIGLPALLDLVERVSESAERESGAPGVTFDARVGSLAAGWGEVPGLMFRAGGGVRDNPPGFVDRLDDIGLPAIEIMDIPRYVKENWRLVRTQYFPLLTSRGCPYSCTYCGASLVSGRRVRRHSVEFLIDLLRRYRDEYGADNFAVIDDAFTEDREFVSAFCEALLAQRIGMRWDCGTNAVRLDTLDADLLKLMERSGCFYISVGIESGSEKVLKDMRRKRDIAEVRDRINLVKRSTDMVVGGFFILGYPVEGREDLKKTIRLALDLPLDLAQFWVFSPYPGTEIARWLEREGRLDGLDYSNFHNFAPAMASDGVSPRTIKRYQRYAYVRFYSRPRIIASTVRMNIRSPGDVLRTIQYLLR